MACCLPSQLTVPLSLSLVTTTKHLHSYQQFGGDLLYGPPALSTASFTHRSVGAQLVTQMESAHGVKAAQARELEDAIYQCFSHVKPAAPRNQTIHHPTAPTAPRRLTHYRG